MAPTVGQSQFAACDEQSSRDFVLGFYGPITGGPDRRAALFDSLSGFFDMPAREAWVQTNEILEGPDVQWAYRRTASATDQSIFAARGSC
jgi:hypothetical protein